MTTDEAIAHAEAHYQRKLHNLKSAHEASLSNMRKHAAVREQLRALWPHYRDPVNHYSFAYSIVKIEEEQLREFSEALGGVQKSHVTLLDGKQRLVNVWYTSSRIPDANFYYTTTLKDDMPCKIVETSEVQRNLVCEVPNAL
jgi:hypothetical protein